MLSPLGPGIAGEVVDPADDDKLIAHKLGLSTYGFPLSGLLVQAVALKVINLIRVDIDAFALDGPLYRLPKLEAGRAKDGS